MTKMCEILKLTAKWITEHEELESKLMDGARKRMTSKRLIEEVENRDMLKTEFIWVEGKLIQKITNYYYCYCQYYYKRTWER